MDSNAYKLYKQFSKDNPINDSVDPYTYSPSYDGMDPYSTPGNHPASPEPPSYKPQYFNSNRYVEPYDSQYFGSSIPAIGIFENNTYVPPADRKIDPNKIFTPDIQALKSLASEQYKTLALFEKKFDEVLRDKNKFGLTEDDIAAMQAITSGRASIAGINNQIVNAKKVAAELKIKQQQQQSNGNTTSPADIGKPQSVDAIGRNIMDNIFSMTGPPITQPQSYASAPEIDPSRDNISALDDIIINDVVSYESMEPTTYVVVSEDNTPMGYETYSKDGRLLSDYPTASLPSISSIRDIDPEAEQAVFDNEIRMPIKVHVDENVIDATLNT